jgi:hypothetical protein
MIDPKEIRLQFDASVPSIVIEAFLVNLRQWADDSGVSLQKQASATPSSSQETQQFLIESQLAHPTISLNQLYEAYIQVLIQTGLTRKGAAIEAGKVRLALADAQWPIVAGNLSLEIVEMLQQDLDIIQDSDLYQKVLAIRRGGSQLHSKYERGFTHNTLDRLQAAVKFIIKQLENHQT